MNHLYQLLLRLQALFTNPMPIITNREMLYDWAVVSLGTDASPYDKAPDELGCAETLTNLIAKVNPKIQWTNPLSTTAVYKDMANGKSFREVYTPKEGDIIISPTKFDITGHCGVVGLHGVIMSNNSFKDQNGVRGIFDENYTINSWNRYFGKKGLKTYYFTIV